MSRAKVFVKFPKAGLGNMLLTWSRAYAFSYLHNLEMSTSSWTAIHWGALIRREKKNRLYIGYFKKTGFFKKLRFLYYLTTKKKIFEPSFQCKPLIKNEHIFIFNKIFTEEGFFEPIRPHKQLVKEGIFKMLQPRLKEELARYEKPVIGIHIRRGDFKLGSTITPISFFIDVIKGLREEAHAELPVTVFTDAEECEIEEVINLNNVSITETKPDILDILLLASSKILVLSIGSTFSYWAAFLSEGIIIRHPKEWTKPFRSKEDPESTNEIVWGMSKPILGT